MEEEGGVRWGERGVIGPCEEKKVNQEKEEEDKEYEVEEAGRSHNLKMICEIIHCPLQKHTHRVRSWTKKNKWKMILTKLSPNVPEIAEKIKIYSPTSFLSYLLKRFLFTFLTFDACEPTEVMILWFHCLSSTMYQCSNKNGQYLDVCCQSLSLLWIVTLSVFKSG